MKYFYHKKDEDGMMKKLFVSAMSILLMMSCMVISTFAEDVENSVAYGSNVMTFDTVLVLSDTAMSAPEVDFKYEITAGVAQSFTDDTTNQVTAVSAGIDADKITLTTTAFTTNDTIAPSATDRTITKKVTVDFSGVVWSAPGIYHYTISATASTVAGVVMDEQTTRDVYVYVTSSDDGYVIENVILTTEQIASTTVSDSTADATKSSGFMNGYGVYPGTDPTPEADETYINFVIDNHVKGNMADKYKDFTVSLSVESGVDEGTIFQVNDNGTISYIAYDGENLVKATYDEDEAKWIFESDAITFDLKHGESYTIYSVVDGMEFKAVMSDEDNYTVLSMYYDDPYDEDHEDWSEDEQLSYTQMVSIPTSDTPTTTIETTDTSLEQGISFQPNYDEIIPETGVIIDFLPYVFMVLLAGGLLILRVFKSTASHSK